MASTPPVVILPTDCCSTACSDTSGGSGIPGPQGPAGANGTNGTNGVNAFTVTTAGFTMPAIAATVNIAVAVSTWASVGQVVFISGAGYFTVTATPDATHITVRNLGYTGNAAPAAIIASAQTVSPGGLQGPTGASGSSTLNDLSPTTTKGDIIVDNGANSPLANDVRLGVGTDGQQLTAVSTQPSGLQWRTTQPNATTDNGIPRYDGTTGTPVPLQTSLMDIADTGAITSTPTGGNARGTNAVDLQVTRTVATQVASGNQSTLGGGASNTASGTDSTVSGGRGNIASGTQSSVNGGISNTASQTQASVTGGSNNIASGVQSFIGGGAVNTASGAQSLIVGGNNNIASADGTTVCGGTDNTASAISASVIGGLRALANKFGQASQSSGRFAANGDSQTSVLVARISTANATPAVMFLDGASLRLTISDDTTWAFNILVVARRTDANDESAAYSFVGCIDRNVGVGTTALVGSVTKVVIAEDTAAWDANVTADAANGALSITVTGEVAKAIQWTARIELVETTG